MASGESMSDVVFAAVIAFLCGIGFSMFLVAFLGEDKLEDLAWKKHVMRQQISRIECEIASIDLKIAAFTPSGNAAR
jgi:hypothetical protein